MLNEWRQKQSVTKKSLYHGFVLKRTPKMKRVNKYEPGFLYKFTHGVDLWLGSVFDNIIELLKRMQEDLLSRVVEAVVLEVKAKSQPYRLDKWERLTMLNENLNRLISEFFLPNRWASLPNPDEFIQPSLSPSGSAMLQAVAIGLLWLKDSLASTLFAEAWQKLAAEINEVRTSFKFHYKWFEI